MLAAVLVRVAGKAPWWLLVPLLPLSCWRRPHPSSSYRGTPLGLSTPSPSLACPLFLPVFLPNLLMHSSISRFGPLWLNPLVDASFDLWLLFSVY